MRLSSNHAARIIRQPMVALTFEGTTLHAPRGQTLATALALAGHLSLRHSLDGQPRGMFCCMGLCQECKVVIDGTVTEACMIEVGEGLAVGSVGAR